MAIKKILPFGKKNRLDFGFPIGFPISNLLTMKISYLGVHDKKIATALYWTSGHY